MQDPRTQDGGAGFGQAPQTDGRALRRALGQFATGVTVVTTRAPDGRFVGLTVNSFSALSLQPPLIVWSLRRASASLDAFERTERFVVNVLAEGQVEASRLFASSTASDDRFAQIAHAENRDGLPFLHGAAAWFACRTVARHDGGDHRLYVAEVERFESSDTPPLLFHGGAYHALGSRL